jgi:hypothetical protein
VKASAVGGKTKMKGIHAVIATRSDVSAILIFKNIIEVVFTGGSSKNKYPDSNQNIQSLS